ncbi:MAG: tRNA (cytidine(34)-2'-O)-methyltransferase [Rhizobiaceae bacterium]
MKNNLRIALYQPEIPGNTGNIIRTAACFGLAVDVIEPAGFDLSDKRMKRAGMDYIEQAALTRHLSWDAFEQARLQTGHRLILATTKSSMPYTDFTFRPGDRLLFGRESAGVPAFVHEAADARITIPLLEGRRSLNLAVAVGIIAAEALRQLQNAV